MEPSDTIEAAVLFADICDSTGLYERAGDRRGYELTAACLDRLVSVSEATGGRVIRTEGDALLAMFEAADDGFLAATHCIEQSLPGGLKIKAGMHAGPMIRGFRGDIYGDTVNLAARVASLSRPGELLLSGDLVALLNPEYRARSHFSHAARLKGKSEPVPVYLVTAASDAHTTMRTLAATGDGAGTLRLTLGGQCRELSEVGHKLTLGRSPENDLAVDSPMVSRQHATVVCHATHFELTDHSTNGTWYQAEILGQGTLRRQSLQLVGDGLLSLGQDPAGHAQLCIRFQRSHATPSSP